MLNALNAMIRSYDRSAADYIIQMLEIELDGRLINICCTQNGDSWKFEGKADKPTFIEFVVNQIESVSWGNFEDIESISVENRTPKQRRMRKRGNIISRSEVYAGMISLEEVARQDAQYEEECKW